MSPGDGTSFFKEVILVPMENVLTISKENMPRVRNVLRFFIINYLLAHYNYDSYNINVLRRKRQKPSKIYIFIK